MEAICIRIILFPAPSQKNLGLRPSSIPILIQINHNHHLHWKKKLVGCKKLQRYWGWSYKLKPYTDICIDIGSYVINSLTCETCQSSLFIIGISIISVFFFLIHLATLFFSSILFGRSKRNFSSFVNITTEQGQICKSTSPMFYTLCNSTDNFNFPSIDNNLYYGTFKNLKFQGFFSSVTSNIQPSGSASIFFRSFQLKFLNFLQ
eukprot:TRINITY_DN10413_c1_g3_i2.p3 TRINITY_DN10413_c1_g3~~TRINITY_DN10413_c1_g3_i2.p3  ORF type:complete len:205 (+),score=-8.13 TRINITY_DN10413_c1_g3_i2:352-966(+)